MTHGNYPYLAILKAIAQRTDLTPADKLVWAAIAEREGSNGASWPSLPTIARDCGISPTTAQRSVTRLTTESIGLLRITRREGQSHTYQTTHPCQNDKGVPSDPCQKDKTTLAKKTSKQPNRNNPITTGKPQTTKTPSEVTTFKGWWAVHYRETQGDSYVWKHARDGANVKWLLGQLNLEQLKAAADNLFAAGDPWHKAETPSINVLSSRINDLVSRAHKAGADEAPPLSRELVDRLETEAGAAKENP